MATPQFIVSAECFLGLTQCLGSGNTMSMRHSGIEHFLSQDIRELARNLLEEHLALRDLGDVGDNITGSDGVVRTHKRVNERTLISLFGEVTIKRLGYGARGHDSLFPKDALLNLPVETYSHGIRKLVAQEVAKSPFNEVIISVKQIAGVVLPRTAVEALAHKAALDFDAFYAQKTPKAVQQAQLLILTTDGKGIVMREEDLKAATRKKTEKTKHKLQKRKSKREKANAQRMATVASVYSIDKFVRTPEQIIGEMKMSGSDPRPRPVDKRVWASVEKESIDVTTDLFEEALRRDPARMKTWAYLVDGDPRQQRRIRATAKAKKIDLTIIVDIIHVIEYLWKAARVFYEKTSLDAETWVSEHLLAILRGKAGQVAAGIRRSATLRKIASPTRAPVDKCAGYLLKNKPYLQYHLYLKEGLPIATGVIEGACRHLIKDRMDVTGAR